MVLGFFRGILVFREDAVEFWDVLNTYSAASPQLIRIGLEAKVILLRVVGQGGDMMFRFSQDDTDIVLMFLPSSHFQPR